VASRAGGSKDIGFGEYRLPRRDRQLHGPEGAIELSARSFDILLLLLERAGAVVGKSELLDAAWPGLILEENTLQVHVSALRKILGPSAIMTVHGLGYKYTGPNPLDLDQIYPENHGHETVRAPSDVANMELTRIAVLPFKNLSGDAKSHSLADGLAEDIITELARYRHLPVTGHHISSQFGEPQRDLAEITKELGVDFIPDGSVCISGNAIHVVVELIDAETGTQALGDRFNSELIDIFAVQDEIVAAVIGHLAFNLTEAAGRKYERYPTSSSLYLSLMEVRRMVGDYAGSLAVMEMIANPPYTIRLYEAASVARLGRTDEAKAILSEAPDGLDHARFVRAHIPAYAMAKDAEHWMESFRLSGIDL
jgi:TolB-like protein